MPDSSAEITHLLREIRDLLSVIAGPQLAIRDQKARGEIVQIVGRSARRRKAILLMDGRRRRVDIQQSTGIDSGELSRFLTALKDAGVCNEENGTPRLLVHVDAGLFDS